LAIDSNINWALAQKENHKTFNTMAELKTKKTELSVDTFLKKIPEEQKRKDAYSILALMEKATKAKPKM
jgi:hypothetical protein